MLTGTYHYPRADGVVFGLPWQEALRWKWGGWGTQGFRRRQQLAQGGNAA